MATGRNNQRMLVSPNQRVGGTPHQRHIQRMTVNSADANSQKMVVQSNRNKVPMKESGSVGKTLRNEQHMKIRSHRASSSKGDTANAQEMVIEQDFDSTALNSAEEIENMQCMVVGEVCETENKGATNVENHCDKDSSKESGKSIGSSFRNEQLMTIKSHHASSSDICHNVQEMTINSSCSSPQISDCKKTAGRIRDLMIVSEGKEGENNENSSSCGCEIDVGASVQGSHRKSAGARVNPHRAEKSLKDASGFDPTGTKFGQKRRLIPTTEKSGNDSARKEEDGSEDSSHMRTSCSEKHCSSKGDMGSLDRTSSAKATLRENRAGNAGTCGKSASFRERSATCSEGISFKTGHSQTQSCRRGVSCKGSRSYRSEKANTSSSKPKSHSDEDEVDQTFAPIQPLRGSRATRCRTHSTKTSSQSSASANYPHNGGDDRSYHCSSCKSRENQLEAENIAGIMGKDVVIHNATIYVNNRQN